MVRTTDFKYNQRLNVTASRRTATPFHRRKRSAGRMGANPYDPLTTINSDQESIMADANLNARPAHPERHVTIQQSWRYRQWKPGYRPDPPLFPWFKVSGRW